MKKPAVIVILLIVFVILCIAPASAGPTATPTLPAGQTARVSAEVGETYIQWQWKFESGTSVPVDIYLDDSQTPIIRNYTSNTYLVEGLDDNGRHNIALYNSTARVYDNKQELVGKATTKLLKAAYEVYFIIAVAIALMLLTIVLGNDLIKLVLLSIFNIIICLFGLSLSNGRGAIPYLFIGIAIITGIILLINGVPKIKEEIEWW